MNIFIHAWFMLPCTLCISNYIHILPLSSYTYHSNECNLLLLILPHKLQDGSKVLKCSYAKRFCESVHKLQRIRYMLILHSLKDYRLTNKLDIEFNIFSALMEN